MFGASQLWGKVGRAFLRSISERQYARFPLTDQFVLDRPPWESNSSAKDHPGRSNGVLSRKRMSSFSLMVFLRTPAKTIVDLIG